MLVSFANQLAVMLNVDCEVTFNAPEERSHGAARVRIPRGSAAWDERILQSKGGALATIHTPLGDRFQGICNPPEYRAVGAEMEVISITRWLDIRELFSGRQFLSAPAGIIAREIFREAFVGPLPLRLGAFMVATPLIPEMTLSGQSVASALGSLMDQTGHVWTLTETGELGWAYRSGRYHEEWLVDDGSLFETISRGTLDDLVAEHIEVDGAGRRFVSRDSRAPIWWPKQEVERI